MFYIVFTGEKLDIANNLTIHKTVLGWAFTGKVFSNQFSHIKTHVHTCFNEDRVQSALLLLVNKSNNRRSKQGRWIKF